MTTHTLEDATAFEATATRLWPMFDDVQSPGAPIQGHGYYHETYRREPAGWRISSQFLSRLRLDAVTDLQSSVQTTFSPLDVATAATARLPKPA